METHFEVPHCHGILDEERASECSSRVEDGLVPHLEHVIFFSLWGWPRPWLGYQREGDLDSGSCAAALEAWCRERLGPLVQREISPLKREPRWISRLQWWWWWWIKFFKHEFSRRLRWLRLEVGRFWDHWQYSLSNRKCGLGCRLLPFFRHELHREFPPRSPTARVQLIKNDGLRVRFLPRIYGRRK